MTDLGTYGSSGSLAFDVSNVGQVVGYNRNPDLAFSWTAKGGMANLGAFGGDAASFAMAVNDAGQVAGNSSTNYGTHAFVWTAQGGMIDLGAFSGGVSIASALNNSGQVVGWSDAGAEHAFVWTVEDGMVDLGTLGGLKSSASAVNEAGWAVGYAEMAYDTVGTRTHAVIWHAPEVQTPQVTLSVPTEKPTILVGWSVRTPGGWLANYDVRYRIAPNNGSFGPFVSWLNATAATAGSFTGKTGNTYCFSAGARDTLGATSAWSNETCAKL